ncbi:ABC transporter permease [Fluoribacter gormanii]|uniref:ABC transporter permease n=1 Tax=Fluoribacter gormanii TaxID=464 RepID=UPI002243F09A|nr:ABC transporter permease [Fluoribacter gormanii]MCW8445042.1 ABC transporter permease [Fluoribacter gormanii]
MSELTETIDINIPTQEISNSQAKLAVVDLFDSIKKWKLWTYLGWNDIKIRYRGSVLGPFWITASMLVIIVAFSVVYSRLFHQSIAEYVPFFTTGYLVWVLISAALAESCNTFVEASLLINEIKLPYILYVFRLTWRHVIIFFHNALVYCAVALYFQVPLNWAIVYVIPGLLLIILNLISAGLILSILGTKYRDIPPIINSLIQVMFFITPISWNANLLPNSAIIVFNPLNYFIDLIRMPLLGQVPGLVTWNTCISITIILSCISFTLFARFRRNIPFWI